MLAIVVGIAVVSAIGANVITRLAANGDMRPEAMAQIKSRTEPVYRVNTNPNATTVAASGGGGAPMSEKQICANGVRPVIRPA